MGKEGIDNISSSIEYACSFKGRAADFKGNDYLEHALRTTIILSELHADEICILASLVSWLPQYVEGYDKNEIGLKFGSEVMDITDSLCKVNGIVLKETDDANAIYMRKVLVGLSTDVRVIILKLACRLDNLRTVYNEPTEEQKAKCIETEKVLIPIAHRLGINYIKSELEDLCLKYLKPDIYAEILENLHADYDELQSYITEMQEILSEMMIEHDIKFRIKGRVKSVHSLYTKLAKGKRWNDIYDILALRLILETESDCYSAIGLIHSKFRPLPKRFKDYIAQPKENMYQSIHTGVIGPNGRVFEIQIRTEDMDELAEYGIASHWSYKEHGSKAIQKFMEQKLEMFRGLMELSKEDSSTVDEFKEAFLSPMIYVFAPNGDIIELPEGATPVDFAYRIHSHIGDTMVGAIVNGQIVQLDTKLENNDLVKIMTNESSSPNKEWLKFVTTNQAKSKIKSFFNKKLRVEYIQKGEELLVNEIKRKKENVNDILSEENISKLTKSLKVKDYDELKFCIGSLKYTAEYALSQLEENKPDAEELILKKITSKPSKKANVKTDIVVDGCDEVLITTANCCKPVYGDEIVGYISKGEGIVVHKTDCINIENMESRFIDVHWSEKQSEMYTTSLLIHSNDLSNNVLAIVTKCVQRGLFVEKVDKIEKDTHIDYALLVRVTDKDSLKTYMNDVESLSFVTSVERVIK